MSIGHFVDKESPPSLKALAEALGPRLPLWEQPTRFIAASYPMTGEWGYGGKN